MTILGACLVALSEFELLLIRGNGGDYVVRIRKRRTATRLVLLDEARKEIIAMVIINADKKRTFAIAAVDAKGRPAAVDGVPEWTDSPTGAVSLFPAADGMSCDVVWLAANPGVVVTVTADADLGEGVTPIVASANVATLGAAAVGLTLSAGPEVDA